MLYDGYFSHAFFFRIIFMITCCMDLICCKLNALVIIFSCYTSNVQDMYDIGMFNILRWYVLDYAVYVIYNIKADAWVWYLFSCILAIGTMHMSCRHWTMRLLKWVYVMSINRCSLIGFPFLWHNDKFTRFVKFSYASSSMLRYAWDTLEQLNRTLSFRDGTVLHVMSSRVIMTMLAYSTHVMQWCIACANHLYLLIYYIWFLMFMPILFLVISKAFSFSLCFHQSSFTCIYGRLTWIQ